MKLRHWRRDSPAPAREPLSNRHSGYVIQAPQRYLRRSTFPNVEPSIIADDSTASRGQLTSRRHVDPPEND